jgi:hypothetical protein
MAFYSKATLYQQEAPVGIGHLDFNGDRSAVYVLAIPLY